MNHPPSEKRQRMLVPFEVGSFLRAPYGWTMRMRHDEGNGAGSGQAKRAPMSRRANLAVALVLYGPLVIGAIAGWRAWAGWSGAGLGVVAALMLQLTVCLTMAPVVAVVRARRPEGAQRSDMTPPRRR